MIAKRTYKYNNEVQFCTIYKVQLTILNSNFGTRLPLRKRSLLQIILYQLRIKSYDFNKTSFQTNHPSPGL